MGSNFIMNPVFSEIVKSYTELTYDPVARSLNMGNIAVAYECGTEFGIFQNR